MNTILKKFSNEIFFYLGYFLLVISDMYNNIEFFQKFYTIFVVISLLLIGSFILGSCINKISRKKTMLLALISMLLLLLYFFSRDTLIIKIYALSLALIFVDFDEFLKKDLKFKILALITLFILSSFVFTSSRSFNRLDGTVRYSLGLQHPNILSAHIMIITFEIYYLYFSKKFSPLFFMLLIITLAFEYIVPNTRTCMFILLLLLFYYCICSKIDIFKRFKKLLCILPLILTILSVVLSFIIFYDVQVVDKINNILSGRLDFYGYYFENVNITILGRNLFKIQKLVALDNAYIYVLLKFGLIQFLIIMYMIYKSLLKNIDKKRYSICIIILLLETYAFVETTPMIPTVNTFLICLGLIFKDYLLKEEPKIDFKEQKAKINTREVQNVQLDILEKLVEYLEKNNIKYYIGCGTLLGAIRHKGFIPWDDDVDLYMPRDDYERLVDMATDKYIAKDIVLKSVKSKGYDFPFIKVFNTNYIVEEENVNARIKYIWVDIFPVDGMTTDEKKHKKNMKQITLCRKLINAKMYRYEEFKKLFPNPIKRFTRIILKGIISLVPIKVYSKKMDKLCKKYPYESSEYVIHKVWSGSLEPALPKKEFETPVDVEFEGKTFKTFSCWELFLTSVFGDYMQLPPEDKRATHLVSFERVERNEKNNNI